MKPASLPGRIIIHCILLLFSLACIIPIISIISISFSDEMDIMKNGYGLLPKKFSLSGYIYVLNRPMQIINAYKISVFVAVVGTILSLIIVSGIAYSLSRPDFKYKKIISFFTFFTLLFNGGLVPWYMLITNYLHLKNSIWVLIVPYLAPAWFILLMKSFMQKIPFEIIESCMIDGASEFRTFVQIILPLSKPALATVGLLVLLLYWNDWWLSLLFIEKESLIPLQYMLYRILANIEYMTTASSMPAFMKDSELPKESGRMAMAIVAAGPMLLIFPFFQKYFTKGLTVGAVKG